MAGERLRRNPTTGKLCRDPSTGKLSRCCGTQTVWYILAVPCRGVGAPINGGVPSSCFSTPRPYMWVCVDAILSDSGTTIRADLGATVDWGCVTFMHNGWCYSLCYSPPGDGGFQTFDPPRLPGSLEIIECGTTISVVARHPSDPNTPGSNEADCGTPLCPTGVRYVAGTLCAGGSPEPPIYVCAGQLTRGVVTGQFGPCVCFVPAAGIDSSAIPAGARVFDRVAYPESNPGPVDLNTTIYAQFSACCQCSSGCAWEPLRRDPTRVCCCGTGRLLSYATGWRVRRSQTNGDYQEIAGSGTAGVPNADGTLPVRYTFTTYRADTNQSTVQQSTVDLPAPGFDCGFPFPTATSGGNWPPPAWCAYGPPSPACTDTYDLPSRFGWPTLLPNTPNGADQLQGTLRGVANASCKSFAAELIGTTIEPDTGERYEARYNINLTYAVDVPAECRGNCVGATDGEAPTGFMTKPLVESVANPESLLP